MGRVKDFDGTLKLSICKKGKSDEEENYNYKNRVIEDKVCIWVGSTGSGKTVANFTRTNMFKKLGYTCIRLTEKKINPFESLCMMIPVKEKYHLDNLKIQGEEPMAKEELKGLVKVWHPLIIPNVQTKDGRDLHERLFKKRHFPINWFCFPIRMPQPVIMAILMGNADKETVRVCRTIVESLDKNEDLWDMVDKVSTEILSKKYAVFYDQRYMGADIGLVGSKRTIETIANSFYIFSEYYCFQPEDFSMEYEVAGRTEKVRMLDQEGILEILNDNKHIHQLSTAHYSDKRAKYVVILDFLLQMADAIQKGRVNHPIYLSLDEIRNLLPKIGKEMGASFQIELSMLIGELLRELRNAGKGVTSDLFTQEYFRTDSEATASVNTRHWMKCSLEDKKILIRDFEWTKPRIELLDGLQTGEGVIVEELDEYEGTKFLVFMPPFSVPEFDALESFSNEYPEEMASYNDLFKRLVRHRKEIEDKAQKRLTEKQITRQKEAEEKKQGKQEKLKEQIEKKVTAKMQKESRQQTKEQLKEECYKMRKEGYLSNKEPISFSIIAGKLGLSDPTTRAYCYQHALKIKDYEFLRLEGKDFLIKE